MIKLLGKQLDDFKGLAGRSQCFGHIVQLIAKTLLRQFEVPKRAKKKWGKGKSTKDGEEAREDEEDEEDKEDEELYALLEEEGGDGNTGDADDEDEGDAEDLAGGIDAGNDNADEDGWVGELAAMSDEEHDLFKWKVRPVCMALTKVRTRCSSYTSASLTCSPCQICQLANKINHSSTILRPAWFELLKELQLPKCILPRDVQTRWMSTFEMALATVEYREAVDRMCSDRQRGLRQYELSNREWAIIEHLVDVLKV